MDVVIRLATEEDFDGLVPILLEIQQLHIEAMPDCYLELSDKDARAWLAKAISDSETTILAAFAESRMVGYALILHEEGSQSPFKISPKFTKIDQLAVLKSFQRQGIATQLLDKVVEISKEHGCVEINLDVLHFNDGAQKFYKSAGFLPYRTRMWQLIDNKPDERDSHPAGSNRSR